MRPSRSELQKIVAIASDHHASIALCGRKNVLIGSVRGRRSASRITSCSCCSKASSTAAGTSWSRKNFTPWVLRFVGEPVARFQPDDPRKSEALEDLRTVRSGNAARTPSTSRPRRIRNDIVHTDSCAFDPCISAADSLCFYYVTIVRCGFHEANYITTFSRSISGSPLLATKARTITAICFLSFIFWADFGLLQCSAAPPQLKRFSPRMTRINANKEPRARILGRQIFNFCGLGVLLRRIQTAPGWSVTECISLKAPANASRHSQKNPTKSAATLVRRGGCLRSCGLFNGNRVCAVDEAIEAHSQPPCTGISAKAWSSPFSNPAPLISPRLLMLRPTCSSQPEPGGITVSRSTTWRVGGPEEGMIRKVVVECGTDDLAFIVDALRPSVGEPAGGAQNDRGA